MIDDASRDSSESQRSPRERWERAVQLQHDAVRAIVALPLDATDAAWAPVLAVVNAATDELCDAARQVPLGTFSDEEWRLAYGLHRDALFAWSRRNASHLAAVAVEARRFDACAVYEYARSVLGPGFISQ